METSISKYESNAISIIRVIAMCSIVLCHFQQALGCKWSWVMNIGVQIFFVLSGYLYGHKDVNNWLKWFISRLTKLYVPLYIYTTVALTCILLLTDTPVGGANYLKAGGVDGLNHLWFMKAIALCYIITPILQWQKKHSSIAIILLAIAGVAEYGFLRIKTFEFSWLWLYAIGYFYANGSPKMQHVIKVVSIAISIIVLYRITWADILDYDGIANRFFHDIMGITLCLCGVYGLSLAKIKSTGALLSLIDRNSFYIYITHHIYLLGPLSLIAVTPYLPINVLLILVLIILSTYILSIVSTRVLSYINKWLPK